MHIFTQMPELQNAKHERFAQEISRGASATAAYIAAGGAENSAGQSAYRVRKRADVQQRIAEIQREREHINAAATELAIERAAVSKEGVIRELAKIAFADIDPKEAKMSDKTAALMNIAKLSGWLIERREQKIVDEFADMSDADLEAWLDERAEARVKLRHRTREPQRHTGGIGTLRSTMTARGKPH